MRISGVPLPPRAGSQQVPGAIIAVTSPKGGVGKTTVATNLAVALARETGMRVVLVDLDLQFGDVSSALGMPNRHSIVDALSKAAARDSFVLSTFLGQHESGVAVLAAPGVAGRRGSPRRRTASGTCCASWSPTSTTSSSTPRPASTRRRSPRSSRPAAIVADHRPRRAEHPRPAHRRSTCCASCTSSRRSAPSS